MNSAPQQHEPVLRQQLNCRGVGFTLLLEDACCQRVRGIVVHYRRRALQNDRAMIVLIVREVNGATSYLDAVGQCGLVDVMPIHPLATEGGD